MPILEVSIRYCRIDNFPLQYFLFVGSSSGFRQQMPSLGTRLLFGLGSLIVIASRVSSTILQPTSNRGRTLTVRSHASLLRELKLFSDLLLWIDLH